MTNTTTLQVSKENALNAYKKSKQIYLTERNNKNWIAFCDAKAVCMRLGVRI